MSLTNTVDVARYPIESTDSDAYRALCTQIRSELDNIRHAWRLASVHCAAQALGQSGFPATVGIGHYTHPLSDKLPAMIVAAVIALVIRVKEIKQISPVAWLGGPQL